MMTSNWLCPCGGSNFGIIQTLPNHLFNDHLKDEAKFSRFTTTVAEWVSNSIPSTYSEQQYTTTIGTLELLKRTCHEADSADNVKSEVPPSDKRSLIENDAGSSAGVSIRTTRIRANNDSTYYSEALNHSESESIAYGGYKRKCSEFLQEQINALSMDYIKNNEAFKLKLSERNITIQDNIARMLCGSHLYGTSTENSDKDIATIYMPTLEDLMLQRAMKPEDISTGKKSSKNSSTDIDFKQFPLPTLIKLCLKGDSTTLELLHCQSPGSSSWVFDELRNSREKFFSKKVPFVGHAMAIAKKNALKGNSLDVLKKVIDKMEVIQFDSKLDKVWDQLPVGEHVKKVNKQPEGTPLEYHVLDKKYPASSKVDLVKKALANRCKRYGDRTQSTMENDGRDWKAIHHALRALYQATAILKKGDFEYPLVETDFLMQVKRGEIDYTTEIEPIFENFRKEHENMAAASELPDAPDIQYWENFLMHIYSKWFGINFSIAHKYQDESISSADSTTNIRKTENYLF